MADAPMLPPELDLVVHATHEAGAKVGGIGAVLDGLLAEPAYNRFARRTLLVGPYDSTNRTELERIHAVQNGFRTIYATLETTAQVETSLARAFERIELYYHVKLLYGKRRFGDAEHEVLLVDPADAVSSVTNLFKFHLWDKFGIDSRRYEGTLDFDRFVAAAEPSLAALQALVGEGEIPRPPAVGGAGPGRAAIIAHEWLGIPLAVSALWHLRAAYKTVLYAHEVATVRRLVESDPGHDTRFYNVMREAERRSMYLAEVFGSQDDYFKHVLILAAASFDGILAVSDMTLEELRFLSPALAARPLALVYNGIPSPRITLRERQAAGARLREYAAKLTGRRPTWVLTHVTRLVPSKGLWRDLRVMEQLDQELQARGERAVLFTLSSAIPAGRSSQDVREWETEYGWPVQHRVGNGDLVGPEVEYARAIDEFNRRAGASQVILFNQFGWEPDRVGTCMPADMQATDIRYGSDLEFGQSIYEPFGIGQLEPLANGALCCLSNVCGSVGFIQLSGGGERDNVLVGDYVTLPADLNQLELPQLLALGAPERELVEAAESARLARVISMRLPRTEAAAAKLLEDGYALSSKMSWKTVVEESFIPALVNLS